MLDVFRKRGVSSVVYSIVMGVIVVAFVINFRPSAGDPMASLKKVCVAKVRGQCVEEKDWKAQRYLLRTGDETVNVNKSAVDSLVERTLLEQEAARLGLRVTEKDAIDEIVRDRVHVFLPAAMRATPQKLGFMSAEGVKFGEFGTKEHPFEQATFERWVSKVTGLSTDEFTDTQEHEILAARVLENVAARVRVSDDEAWDEYSQERSTMRIRTLRLVPAYFSQHFVTMDQASIDAWAAANAKVVDDKQAALPKDKPAPALYRPRHILIGSKKEDTDDKKKAAKDKADELLAKVQKGGDFAALARDNSEDPGSKDKGGAYDWTTGEEYVPEFKDGLAKLKLGESIIVQTQFGYHVLQITGKYEGRTAIAQPLYASAKGEELAQQAADKIAERLKTIVPVKLDDSLKAKVDEAKKSGKSETDATEQVIDDETHARVGKAVDDVLAAMAPKEVEAKGAKKIEAPKPKKEGEKAVIEPPPVARWKTDERYPRLEDSSAFNSTGSPIIGLMDQDPITLAASKLTAEAPLAPVLKAGGDSFLVLYKDRHDATRADFDKDKAQYMGGMLLKKREDAVTNYITALRDGLGKDLFIDPKYTAGDKENAGKGGPPQQQPADDDGS
ncbi:MAG: peptidylprolyl isomerase [Polyangiales bacterium]